MIPYLATAIIVFQKEESGCYCMPDIHCLPYPYTKRRHIMKVDTL